MPMSSYAWEMLDLLTLDDGINVYMATDGAFYWTAPTFGSNLQNRIWNFEKNLTSPPDAYIYSITEELYGGSKSFFYLKQKILFRDVFNDPHYDLILTAGASFLFVSKGYLSGKMDRLAKFYKSYFWREIKLLEDTALPLSKDIPVFDSTEWGHAMKYLSLFERSGYSVYLLPATAPVTNITALNNSRKYFYTINMPFPDTKTEKVYEADASDALGRRLTIYKNSTKP